MELGNGRVGRIRMEKDELVTDLFDQKSGVPEGWAQVFEIGGVVGFNIADQILRFDEATRQFLPDTDFNIKYPGLTEIAGRPGLDARGGFGSPRMARCRSSRITMALGKTSTSGCPLACALTILPLKVMEWFGWTPTAIWHASIQRFRSFRQCRCAQ